MRTLFLSPRQCWPVRSGAKLREHHFARALGQLGPLTYVYFGDPGEPPLTTQELPFCDEVIAVPKPTSYGPVQIAQGILTRWPLPILNYSSEAMTRAVGAAISKHRYDLIHFDSIHMIRYADTLPGQKIVYNWHNIESEAMARYAQTVTSPARRWYANQTARKLAGLEREILRTAFGHVVCSERERQQLRRLQPEARIEVVENGVDVGYYAGAAQLTPPAPSAPAQPSSLIFVGTMDYYPNVEAVTSFVRNIWPSLRSAWPQLHLWIVGAKPTADVRALEAAGGITVTGTVDDVRRYYGNALAAVVPLRTGGGTRLKILEAMAAGVPVISTPLGAEGLDVHPDRDILMVAPDDTAGWAACVARLADSATLRAELTSAAAALVGERYDWDHLGKQLGGFYQRWLEAAR